MALRSAGAAPPRRTPLLRGAARAAAPARMSADATAPGARMGAQTVTPRMPRPLPISFYARDAETVAREVLGATLCHRVDGSVRRVRIVETEAYVGTHDLACHASRGRTPRTEVMFGLPAHAYVYFVYGMHHMLNIVTGDEGDAQAVLVRAAEPLAGVAGRTDGPARLTRALGITTARQNRVPVTAPPLWLEQGPAPKRVNAGPRIGVDYAGEVWAHAPLRFFDAASTHVSRP